jgi:xanthine dehydrogenase large subunit
VRFEHGKVCVGERPLEFAEVVQAAYFARVQLSATGFYARRRSTTTATGPGPPVLLLAYGAAVAECRWTA